MAAMFNSAKDATFMLLDKVRSPKLDVAIRSLLVCTASIHPVSTQPIAAPLPLRLNQTSLGVGSARPILWALCAYRHWQVQVFERMHQDGVSQGELRRWHSLVEPSLLRTVP